MIVFDKGVESVKIEGVLYSHKDAVRSLAILMMAAAAEGNVDMILDEPEEYPTKKDIEAVFAPLNELALDMLTDHIDELKHNLENFLKNAKFKAHVSRLYYNKEGALNDVFVELDVE